jgi:hypothetical protein
MKILMLDENTLKVIIVVTLLICIDFVIRNDDVLEYSKWYVQDNQQSDHYIIEKIPRN